MKSNRQDKILELVATHDIETQEELATLLKENGVKVTQATISRDIRELNLTKITAENGRQKYIVLGRGDSEGGRTQRYARMLREAVINADTAKNLLVIRTNPGMASVVGAAIDALGLQALVGCLAGDDTVVCAFKEEEDAIFALEELQEKMNSAAEEKASRKSRR